ncbi:glycosyl hydrolase family 65, N-terminal domain-containing protein [Apiosordaria backusii]|uniref:Glycosyl hydrolase family 65, N-terminal domain-containing protein n=1 Tax=Apiosordaria backusii TaxID=314023 RepID=A0AA40BRI0_9PEZI|nr:glycosyl hydrolase family 65, N-terminal domain-containing protein [Apiosordaria backusii]
MARLLHAVATLLTATGLITVVDAANKGNSKSNPWRIWDDAPGGSNAFAEYYPIGNGRVGIMLSGDPRTEQIRLNENSFWSGSLLDRVNPDALSTVEEMRRLIREERYAEAEDLGLQGYTGMPLSTRHYDKMGNLRLTQTLPDGEVTDYERWLGVDDAVAGVSFSVGNVTYQREYLSSYPDDIVAIHIKASTPGSIHLRARLDRGSDLNRYQGYSDRANGHSIVMGGQSMDAKPLHWAAGARIVSLGGKVTVLGDTVRCEGADEATVFFQAWTSYRKPEPMKAVLSDLAAISKSFSQIREAHVADYQKYAGRVSLSLGDSTASQRALKTATRMTSITADSFDPELAALFFQFGRYLFISTSRPETGGGDDKSLPPNLQGIWNDVYNPMWGSKYTININLQMNYWPSLVTGLSDLVTPLNNLLKVTDKQGRKVAATMYNASGTVTHHNTDMWGDSAPQDNYTPATFWPMGATWMITHVIEHYRFTGDRSMLQDMFPTLQAITEFALDFLTPYKDYLVTNPSSSPENTFFIPGNNTTATNNQPLSLSPGPTIDNVLLREIFTFLPQAQTILNITPTSPDFTTRLSTALSKLPPLRLNQYSGIAEWISDYTEAQPGNGHMSHLVPVYPLSHITTSINSTFFSAAITSLEHRLQHGGAPCGWPRVWSIALASRLFRPDITGPRLISQMGECSWNRTMLNMGGAAPFQIDGSLGVTGAVVEAFVQSHEVVLPVVATDGREVILEAVDTGRDVEGRGVTLIRLLPSVPKMWVVKNGGGGGWIKGLQARGGFSVDLSWDGEGVLKRAEVTSKGGNVAYVVMGQARVGGGVEEGATAIRVNGGEAGVFVRLEGGEGTVFVVEIARSE